MANVNLDSLTWIKTELERSLDSARQRLDAFAEEPDNRELLREVVELLHQVAGTLTMVEVHGGRLLAEHLEALAQMLYTGHLPPERTVLEPLMRGCLELSDYLDRMVSGMRDSPAVLLPVTNELRNLIGREPLVRRQRQHPVLPLPRVAVAGAGENLPALAARLCPRYQAALLAFYHGTGGGKPIAQMRAVVSEMELVASYPPAFEFLWVVGGVLEALDTGGLAPTLVVKRLLGQVERELKRLAITSEAALAETPPEALVEEMLEQIEHATSSGERVSVVRANFQRDKTLQDEDRDGIGGGRNSALLRGVSTAILEDLNRVHDRIDIFMRTGRKQPAELAPVATTLKKAADAMSLMGLTESSDRVRQQSETVAQMASGGGVEEAALLQLATELIGIESEVEAFLHGAGMNPQAAAQRNARLAALREVLADISRIKNVIGEHMRNSSDAASLRDLPRLADNLARILGFMNLSEVALLVHRMACYLDRIAVSEVLPERIELDRLADAVVSIEYYVEALQRERGAASSILENAARALLVLGVDESQGAAREYATVQRETRSATAPEPEQQWGAESQAESRLKPGAVPVPQPVSQETVELLPVRKEGADPEIIEIFIEEAQEVLEVLDQNYPRWRDEPDATDVLATVRRAFHTLKGSGRMVGAKRLGEFAWVCENLLNRVIDHTVAASDELINIIGDAIVATRELSVQFRDGTEGRSDIVALTIQIQRIARGEVLAEIQAEPLASETGIVEGVAEVSEGTTTAAETKDMSEFPAVAKETVSEVADEPRIDPTLYDIYLNETHTHLEAMRKWLGTTESERGPKEEFALQRAVHTLLGSARMAEVNEVAALLAPLDRLLKHAESGQIETVALSAEIEAAATTTEALVHAYGASARALPEWEPLREHFESLLSTQESEAKEKPLDIQVEQPAVEAGAAESTPLQPERPAIRPAHAVTVIDLVSLEGYDRDLAEVFLSEAGELLEGSDASVQAWADNHDRTEPLTDLLRRLHTLKGGARMAGITPLADMSHELESLLVRVADGRVAVSGDLVRLIERTFDRLHRMLEHAGGDGRVPYDTAVVMELQRYAGSGSLYEEEDEDESGLELEQATGRETSITDTVEAEPGLGEAEEPPSVTPRLRHEMARVRADLLETSINNAGELSIYRSRVEQQLVNMNQNLAELDRTVERVHTQLRELDIETEAQIISEHRAESVTEDFDPLEFDRYTRLHELSRSLDEAVSDLSSLRSLLASELQQANVFLERQGRINGDLQDALMRTRMVPFSLSAGRLHRIVRNTSEEVGKRAELSMSGTEGEMDRQVLEHILPALEHLLRNAVVHGIEGPEVRKSRGKPENGQIQLNLRREGADIMIEVIDDGGGLDLKAIRAKAEEEGIIAPGLELGEQQIVELVFRPGFSTASALTQTAGRGVGLDVVAAEARQVGGSVEVETKPFEGACWRLRLPVTLAITRTLLVRIGRTLYPVPLASLGGIQRIKHDELDILMNVDNPSYEYGDNTYRLLSLAQLLGEEVLSADEVALRVPLLLINVGDRYIALIADDMEGNREVVVKPVGPQIAHVPGISGATIFGDGSIGLLLDLAALVRALPQTMEAIPIDTEQRAAIDVAPLVMVVDDSITVRRVTQRLLERRGIRVLTAKDGVEALEQLQDYKPDAMLLDIEMPRMDGYELAGHMKNDPHLRDIPIIVITSRTGEKHRARADQIGIEHYIGKPYQEVELLEAIQSVVTGFDPLATRTMGTTTIIEEGRMD
jgi:chemosensory pili system protein ChpA (sensor histidine kinase/response regulator)